MGRSDSTFALRDYGVTIPPFAMCLWRDESAYRKLRDIEDGKIALAAENGGIGLNKKRK